MATEQVGMSANNVIVVWFMHNAYAFCWMQCGQMNLRIIICAYTKYGVQQTLWTPLLLLSSITSQLAQSMFNSSVSTVNSAFLFFCYDISKRGWVAKLIFPLQIECKHIQNIIFNGHAEGDGFGYWLVQGLFVMEIF